jgi:diamine N-acetyltransferase
VTQPTKWSVQRASSGDAEALANFAAASFRDAFGALNNPNDVVAYCAGAFNPDAQRRELADPGMTTFVVRRSGVLIGYAQLQDAEPPHDVEQLPAVLLKRIYVDQGWLGTGVALSLMQAVVKEAVDRGARTLWLTVWERNPRAVRFYTRLGMSIIGEADFLLGSELQRDHVMAIPVPLLSAALEREREERAQI